MLNTNVDSKDMNNGSSSKIKQNKMYVLLLAIVLFVSACQSTSTRNQPLLVGPVAPETSSKHQQKNVASLQNANVFLDVAVPVFDPGFPMQSNGTDIDYEEMDDEGIWPQLRRTEAKLFAVETKKSLENTGAFGAVSVVPDANTSADVFVLGKILHSDSEVVEMELTVVDASGEILGIKEFEHEVDESFIKDQRNAGKNPYQPIFDQGRDYVVALLSRLSDEEKQEIKNVATVRYARYYNPDEYSQYLSTEIERKNRQRYYKFSLEGMPAENDPMLNRIEDLRAQELLFVDRLQDQYDTFYAETNDAYYTWQRETLPEIIARREAQTERNIKAGLGVGLAILAGILANKSSDSSASGSSTRGGAEAAGAVLAGVGSMIAINDAFQSNSEMKVQSAIIEEKGQAVDLTLGPTEMKFADQIIELKGTASEQYMQWKQHLRDMYELEKTPDVQL
ncbi:hypothetical protein [Glaciecola sp. 1036]|uniref:hypothetical protein n=1 Tax=Alteromonadaceae TaxID=72275 RepID=UPI003CFCB33D